MSVWDPMKEQYFSKRNAYSVDVNDPAVAMLGYGEYARVSVIRESLFVHVWLKCYKWIVFELMCNLFASREN